MTQKRFTADWATRLLVVGAQNYKKYKQTTFDDFVLHLDSAFFALECKPLQSCFNL